MPRRTAIAFIALCLALCAVDSNADKTLLDYRYFRALSIDLVGRPPTRDELRAFEQPSFSLDAWLNAQLQSPSYAERVRRVYTDLLRLEIGPTFQFSPNPLMLRRQQLLGPDGKNFYVYFRRGQRRADISIDGEFCFTTAETGMTFPPNAAGVGTPIAVTQDVIDARTVLVKPWWLYADYASATPHELITATTFAGFTLAPPLLTEADNLTTTTEVRVCREEAQTAAMGTVYASGRVPAKKTDPLPVGRTTQPPNDSAFAKTQHGQPISCESGTGYLNSIDCGCGVGLERCLPGGGSQLDPPALMLPTHTPLGFFAPFDVAPQSMPTWLRLWWGQEASHFLDDVFANDRDMRDILKSHGDAVNGPLAQFYRFMASATCCGVAQDYGYSEPEPLVNPAAVPTIAPQDIKTWLPIADRGPHASGLLTMPVFLTKYGSRRARAHVLYNAFLCKDFVADTVKLTPSKEADLTKRPGCSTCHRTLEPMSAYFTRIAESDWTYLPEAEFPTTRYPASMARCAKGELSKQPAFCKTYYDPSFTDAAHTMLRGAYSATDHVDAGPAGLADELIAAPEFAPCVVQNVAQSFLGRELTAEDDAWKTTLTKIFVDGGYRVRSLVRAIVTSARYRTGNDQLTAPPVEAP